MNSKVVFATDAAYGIEAGVEYELFDSEDGSSMPFFIVPKGDEEEYPTVWLNMGTMKLDNSWDFTMIPFEGGPCKTLKQKKVASENMKRMLEEMEALQESILLIKSNLIDSGVKVSIDFEEFTANATYRQLHKLL